MVLMGHHQVVIVQVIICIGAGMIDQNPDA